MFENLCDGPLGTNGEELRGHQSADASLWISEECARDLLFSWGEECEELGDDGSRQFLEHGCAIVAIHLIQDAGGLFISEVSDDALLFLRSEVFEDLGGEILGEKTEDDGLIFFGEFGDDFADVRSGHFDKELADRGKVSRGDELVDFWTEKITQHGD